MSLHHIVCLCTAAAVWLASVDAALRKNQLLWDNDFDGIHDGTEMELAKTFAPILHFHEGEHFFPADVNSFLNHSRLFFRSSDIVPDCEVFVSAGAALPTLRFGRSALRGTAFNVDVEAALAASELHACESSTLRCTTVEYPLMPVRRQAVECVHVPRVDSSTKDSAFYLEVGGDYINRLSAALNPDVPVYVHVFPTMNQNFPADSISIQYWFFYPFHGPIQTFVAAGAHEGDWEHVTVVINNRTHDILGVYLAEHAHEAFWLTKQDVTFTDTHVHVFPAMLTHAFYESPMEHRRARTPDLGTLVDFTSMQGVAWMPHNMVNMGERHFPGEGAQWLSYNGYWGSKRIRYSHTPLQLDTGHVPLGPAFQDDYWLLY